MKHDLTWLYGSTSNLSALQKLKLRLFGNVYLGSREHSHGTVALFLVHCRRHGDYVDMEHGWFGYFQCPACLDETAKNQKQPNSHLTLQEAPA